MKINRDNRGSWYWSSLYRGSLYWVFCGILLYWAGSGKAVAGSADLNINPDMIRFSFESFVKRQESADFGFMMFERKNPKTDYALQTGYNVKLNPDLNVGARAIYVSPGAYDMLVVGIGAAADVRFGVNFGFGGELYYAPSILSLFDADKFVEYSMHFSYYIIPPAQLYIGYRKMEFRANDNRSFELDDDLHIGFKLKF